jgi:membrane dipeptidase
VTSYSPNADPRPGGPVFDGHVDLIYTLQQVDPVRPLAETESGPLTPQSLADGQVRIVNSAIFCFDHFNGEAAVQHMKQLLLLSEALCADMPLLQTRLDLERAWQTPGEIARLLLLENADALVDLGTGALAAWGIRTVGLTHVGSNRLADGNTVQHPQGLKPPAKDLLLELEQGGIVIDVAHLAEPGFWQLLDRFAGRLCCSHTGLRCFCDRPRNLSDEQVHVLLEREGMIGLSFAPEMLTPNRPATVDDVFRQIDHLVQRFGSRGIGIGSDLGGYDGSCVGLEDHGRLVHLVEAMILAGYHDSDINALLGDNWYRFYRDILPTEAPG